MTANEAFARAFSERWPQVESAECRCGRFHSFKAPDGSETCPPCFLAIAVTPAPPVKTETSAIFAGADQQVGSYLDVELAGKNTTKPKKEKKGAKAETIVPREMTPIAWDRWHGTTRCQGRCRRFLDPRDTREPVKTPAGRLLCADCAIWRREKIRRARDVLLGFDGRDEGLRTLARWRAWEIAEARKAGYDVPPSMVERCRRERESHRYGRFAD